ncbi:hypothetical protein [Burkholderia sp. AU38729]|uniref:hypothetical protein n=1 Tax=Burkholderia sp. AU38729 TaxID=2879633 RepID=UPI001CF4D903|nr:hypothetical protein [Burkholderia sp. AU38729]MCA8067805.1 hypothetical protein [Burkholderia sp. AU38729]
MKKLSSINISSSLFSMQLVSRPRIGSGSGGRPIAGAKTAGRKPVVAIIGDGSARYAPQAL